MKLIIERLSKSAKSSFVLQKDIYDHYPTPWHHHPEYELVLVLKSSGQKIIGDHISSFSDGDLAFLGSNLPHVYHNNQNYYHKDSGLTAEAIVIQFNIDFLGEKFFNLPEMNLIAAFLEDSAVGFSIQNSTRKEVANRMIAMLTMSETERIIELITILNLLSQTKDKVKLASPGFVKNFKVSGSERITEVCDFIMKNFANDLTLNQVAKIANMSDNAFCKFFKERTRKTFISFLNEVRIGYACKLLIGNQYNISEICHLCGFNNLSNFNRQFNKFRNKSPQQYKKEILKSNNSNYNNSF